MRGTLFLSYHLNNRVFELGDPIANRDNVLQWWFDLRQEFLGRGIDLSTQDINSPSESAFVLYHDMPRKKAQTVFHKNSYLMIVEPPVVKKKAWDKRNHGPFKRIFTYDDSMLTNDRYVKINYSYDLPNVVPRFDRSDTKLCTTIIGRKESKHPGQLYGERLACIRWFEHNHPEEFEFYGMGWEGYQAPVPGLIPRLLKRTEPLHTYRGTVVSKLETFKKYRFAICFENCKSVPGYISEKIFDCFFAGIVPVYFGAPNVQDHIPDSCFVDFRKFRSYEEMYGFLKNMSDATYEGYLQSLEQFLNSSKAEAFRSRNFAKTVADSVLSSLPEGG